MQHGIDPAGAPSGDHSPGGAPAPADPAQALRRRDAELRDADLAERLDVDPEGGDVKG
jgi:hypothetical protein